MHPIHLNPHFQDASFEEEAPLSLFAVLARGLLVLLRWPLRFFGISSLILFVLFLAFGLNAEAFHAFVFGLGFGLTRLGLEHLARRRPVQGARVGPF